MSGKGLILLADNDTALNNANDRALRMRGFETYRAETFKKARETLLFCNPDIILLDAVFPDGDGYAFCAEIRDKTTAHIIFLTDKKEHNDIIRGLSAGADDYITKPFHPEELFLRIEAAMRRRRLCVKTESVLQKDALLLDGIVLKAYYNNMDLRLTPKEFSLLFLLMQNTEKVLNPDYIYEKLWGYPINGDKNAIQTITSRLRKKIKPYGYTIFAYRGRGYSFERLILKEEKTQ